MIKKTHTQRKKIVFNIYFLKDSHIKELRPKIVQYSSIIFGNKSITRKWKWIETLEMDKRSGLQCMCMLSNFSDFFFLHHPSPLFLPLSLLSHNNLSSLSLSPLISFYYQTLKQQHNHTQLVPTFKFVPSFLLSKKKYYVSVSFHLSTTNLHFIYLYFILINSYMHFEVFC